MGELAWACERAQLPGGERRLALIPRSTNVGTINQSEPTCIFEVLIRKAILAEEFDCFPVVALDVEPPAVLLPFFAPAGRVL